MRGLLAQRIVRPVLVIGSGPGDAPDAATLDELRTSGAEVVDATDATVRARVRGLLLTRRAAKGLTPEAADALAMRPLFVADALVALVEACHARGIRVIGDLTINHVGAGHEWFRAARADPAAAEAPFFHFRDHPDDYEAWFDVPTLPKLDLRGDEVRRRLLAGPDSVAARWLQPPFDLDGWRVDVANMAGRLRDVDVNRDVARAMRATMAAVRRLAVRMEETLEPDGFNVLNACRPAAWQTVFHFHIHVIPRYQDDPLKLPWIPREADLDKIAAVADEIRGGAR